MKNKKTFSMLSLVLLTALSGCNPNNNSSGSGDNNDTRTKIEFLTGFGQNVNAVLKPLLKRFEDEHPTIKVDYNDQGGGYDTLKSTITSSVSTTTFPHIANGYPDHFAEYANSNILLNLNSNNYIKNTDPEIGVDIDHYLPSYMVENTTLVPGATTGLPFNKSTEVMVTNQTFFDVASSLDATIKVPETWQELAVQGRKIKALAKSKGWFGNLVKHNGDPVAKKDKMTKEEIEALLPEIAFDMTMVTETTFVPFSWDSGANFFITIVRQWGAEYTKQGDNFQSGKMAFNKGESYTKTVTALKYFQGLFQEGIVGIPATYGEGLYSSLPFKQGKLVLTISSSAGISNNMPAGTTDFPFEVSVNKIPFNADLPANKFVISQGTNLALFARGKMDNKNREKTQKERDAAWQLLRYLTYEVNHEFGMGTSYFPVTDGTKLAVDENDQRYKDYKLYLDFLNKTETDKTKLAIRDTAKVQAEQYQEKATDGKQIWTQFVDPGFLGSSDIRSQAAIIISKILDQESPLTPEAAIKGAEEALPLYK